eukprot:jgi/Bigna1/71556/fgenesh1_pg.16_\
MTTLRPPLLLPLLCSVVCVVVVVVVIVVPAAGPSLAADDLRPARCSNAGRRRIVLKMRGGARSALDYTKWNRMDDVSTSEDIKPAIVVENPEEMSGTIHLVLPKKSVKKYTPVLTQNPPNHHSPKLIEVSIRSLNAKMKTFHVLRNTTIEKLLRIDPNLMHNEVMYNGRILDPKGTLAQHRVLTKSTLFQVGAMGLREGVGVEQSRYLQGFDPRTTIKEFKQQIAKNFSIPVATQILRVEGRDTFDIQCLGDFGAGWSTIQAVVSLREFAPGFKTWNATGASEPVQKIISYPRKAAKKVAIERGLIKEDNQVSNERNAAAEAESDGSVPFSPNDAIENFMHATGMDSSMHFEQRERGYLPR